MCPLSIRPSSFAPCLVLQTSRINRSITGAIVARQPFGGYKLSGVGSKAGGPDYLLQFLDPRTVTENIQRQGFAPITFGASEAIEGAE
jgi:delta 1-pyrroline-5-carboxylate dehydrogenase